jgi:hypothetical protein
VQHQSGDWQQQLMAKRCFLFWHLLRVLHHSVCSSQFSGLRFAQSPKGYQTHHTRLWSFILYAAALNLTIYSGTPAADTLQPDYNGGCFQRPR